MNKKQQKAGLLVLGKPEAFGKCKLEGFVARSGGAKRESNPYDSKRNWNTDAANAHPGRLPRGGVGGTRQACNSPRAHPQHHVIAARPRMFDSPEARVHPPWSQFPEIVRPAHRSRALHLRKRTAEFGPNNARHGCLFVDVHYMEHQPFPLSTVLVRKFHLHTALIRSSSRSIASGDQKHAHPVREACNASRVTTARPR